MWRFMGVWMQNRAEWTKTELACMHYKMTTVGFYDAMGVSQVDFILNQTEMSTIVGTLNYAKKVLDMKKNGQATHIKNLVLVGESQVPNDVK